MNSIQFRLIVLAFVAALPACRRDDVPLSVKAQAKETAAAVKAEAKVVAAAVIAQAAVTAMAVKTEARAAANDAVLSSAARGDSVGNGETAVAAAEPTTEAAPDKAAPDKAAPDKAAPDKAAPEKAATEKAAPPPGDKPVAAAAHRRAKPGAKARAPKAKGPALSATHPVKVASIKEYFDTLDRRFQAGPAKDVHAVFQFDLTGAHACAYHVHVDGGTMKLEKGHTDMAAVTIGATADDYLKVVNGDLGGTSAYFSKRMNVHGDLGLARKMKKIFPTMAR